MKSPDAKSRSISKRQIGQSVEVRQQGNSPKRYKPYGLKSDPLSPKITKALQTQGIFTQESSSERPAILPPVENHPLRDDSSSEEDRNICHAIASTLCLLSSRKEPASHDRSASLPIQRLSIEETQPLLQGQPSLGEAVQLPENTSQSSNSPAQDSYHTPECNRGESNITTVQPINIPQLSHQSTSWLSQPPASLLQEASSSLASQPPAIEVSFEQSLEHHKNEMLNHRIPIAERVQNNLESLYEILKDPSVSSEKHKAVLQGIVDLIVVSDQEKIHPEESFHQTQMKKIDLSQVRTAALGALVYALKHSHISNTNKKHIVSFIVRFSENPDTFKEPVHPNSSENIGGVSVNYQQNPDNSGMREETRTLHLSERIGIPSNPHLRLDQISQDLACDIRQYRTRYKNKLLNEHQDLIAVREDLCKRYEAELSECLNNFNRGSSEHIKIISEKSDKYREELKFLKAAYKKISSQDQGALPRQIVTLLDKYNEDLFRYAQRKAPQAAASHQPEEWNNVINSNPLNAMSSDQGVSYQQYNAQKEAYFHEDLEAFIKSFQDENGQSLFSGADGIENGYLKDYEAAGTIQSPEDCIRSDGTPYTTDRVQKEDPTGRRYSEDVIVEPIPAKKPSFL